MKIADRLRAVSAEIRELDTELKILDEQIAFQSEVSEDARIRAMVSGTPLADREAREARDVLDRLVRSRDEAAGRHAKLREDQDALLERFAREG